MKKVALSIIFIFTIQFFGCNEELVVDQKDAPSATIQKSLLKEDQILSVLQDPLKEKEKKDKLKWLKAEHEKPYVVIEKPEKLLAEKLKSRIPINTFSKSANSYSLNSAQSSQSCYFVETDIWALYNYQTLPEIEFGIMPHENRMYAGSSGNPYFLQKLNELKTKWGFNYICAAIGDLNNIQAIVYAGYPISTNYMASGFIDGGQLDRATVANQYNGLSPEIYFWAYYFDEPYSHTDYAHVTQSSFKNFRDYIKSLRPNSLFGFGETNVYSANRYTHNPYFWFTQYYTNNYPTDVDIVMCTRYIGYYGESDQRDLWSELKTSYTSKFNRTWISANLDRGEFNLLLGHAKNKGAAPWLFQMNDNEDISDNAISEYCYNAYVQAYLIRKERKYIYVWSYIGMDDPCSDYQITNWELFDIIETNEIRILTP